MQNATPGLDYWLAEDVENFFRSVTAVRVRSIFMGVFRFSEPVALLLTKLFTRNGSLAQGAKTSTYLANLALFREEPELYRRLIELGVEYTRFINDMHSSTRRYVSRETRTDIVRLMRGTLERAGLRPKRTKQFVAALVRR